MYYSIETTKGGFQGDSLEETKQKYLQFCFDNNESISIDSIIEHDDEEEKFLNQFIKSFEEEAADYIKTDEQHPDEVAKEALSLMGWKN